MSATAADHAGATSGESRVNPIGYLADESKYRTIASHGGAPGNPACWHSCRAEPRIEIEVGRETIDLVAEEATGGERERLLRRGAERFPDLFGHATRTDRNIPVIVLAPAASA